MSFSRLTIYLFILSVPHCSFGFSREYHSYLKDDTVVLSYFKKVGSDSAYIYFTEDFKFTEASCARIIRYTPLNEKDFTLNKWLERSTLARGLNTKSKNNIFVNTIH